MVADKAIIFIAKSNALLKEVRTFKDIQWHTLIL